MAAGCRSFAALLLAAPASFVSALSHRLRWAVSSRLQVSEFRWPLAAAAVVAAVAVAVVAAAAAGCAPALLSGAAVHAPHRRSSSPAAAAHTAPQACA